MTVTNSADRTGRLTASAADSDGTIASGTVDWGDGTTSPINSGFASISTTRLYTRAQAYTVTLRVVDDKGAATTLTRSVTIRVPPEACLGILVIEVCAEATANFSTMRLEARAGDIVLAGANLNDGAGSVVLPLAGGFGRLTLSHNFNTGRLTITGEVCPVPFLVCQGIGSQTIQL
jgi:hypothetical protein